MDDECIKKELRGHWEEQKKSSRKPFFSPLKLPLNQSSSSSCSSFYSALPPPPPAVSALQTKDKNKSAASKSKWDIFFITLLSKLKVYITCIGQCGKENLICYFHKKNFYSFLKILENLSLIKTFWYKILSFVTNIYKK